VELLSFPLFKLNERIVWLIQKKQFPRALYLCKRYNRKKQLPEVANAHALDLWEAKEREQAMAIWGEYVLSASPSQYWKMFADRLHAQDRLDLLENYVPFQRPSLVGLEMYLIMLQKYLEKEDYLAFYERVLRWPTVYNVSALIQKIEKYIQNLCTQYNPILQKKKERTKMINPKFRNKVKPEKKRFPKKTKKALLGPDYYPYNFTPEHGRSSKGPHRVATKTPVSFDDDREKPKKIIKISKFTLPIQKCKMTITYPEPKKPKKKKEMSLEKSPISLLLPGFLSAAGCQVTSPLDGISAPSNFEQVTEIETRVSSGQLKYIYLSLFHLLKITGKVLDAGKILVSFQSPFVFSFWSSNNLWSYFQITNGLHEIIPMSSTGKQVEPESGISSHFERDYVDPDPLPRNYLLHYPPTKDRWHIPDCQLLERRLLLLDMIHIDEKQTLKSLAKARTLVSKSCVCLLLSDIDAQLVFQYILCCRQEDSEPL